MEQTVTEGLNCSKNTVHDYLGYLEDAYMIESMFIETASERRRMTNPRKVYAIDPGLVNAFVGKSGGWGLGRSLADDKREARKLILTLHEEKSITRDGLEIDILPAWKWFGSALPRDGTN